MVENLKIRFGISFRRPQKNKEIQRKIKKFLHFQKNRKERLPYVGGHHHYFTAKAILGSETRNCLW